MHTKRTEIILASELNQVPHMIYHLRYLTRIYYHQCN
jgi:hypothetical protein